MAPANLILGCGFLGERVARVWLAQGRGITALTRSEQNAARLQELGIVPLVGDVTDAASLHDLPEADTVLYAIGLDRGSGRSQREVYVDGLHNVLEVLPHVRQRLIYVSSTSVYGQDSAEWVDETSPCAPTSPNGRVCLDAEQLLRHLRPEAIILRLAGLYGAGRLAARLDRLRAGAVLKDNPAGWVNLIHVDDAVAAVLAAERLGRPGETYLCCDDRPVQRGDYLKLLARNAGAPEPRFAFDSATGGGPQLGKRCSNRRMHEELRVALKYPTIEQGLASV